MSDSSSIPTPGLDDADAVWELLSERVDALIAAWEAGGELPELGSFLPAGAAPIRRLALVELAKVDMDYRRRRGDCVRRVEQYVELYPELAAEGGVPCDLIYEEYHLRRQAGEPVAPQEYLKRFPREAQQLRRLLNLPHSQRTTSIFVPTVSADLEVGESIDDFDLLTQLGAGAFATVFLARQRSLQRLVALKASANMGSEPQTLAQLDHPHIVRVYDQRIVPDRDLRLLYMQYVAGGTLQDVIRRAREVPFAQRSGRTLLEAVDAALDRAGQSPPLDSLSRKSLSALSWPQAVCRVGQQLAAALDYAHRRGVLHRDVKPANVLMSAEGGPRLADFNISFCSKLDGASPAAYFGGSLAYMSPEQLEACSPQHERQPDSLDGRCDVYSLGVVLWELLTGNRPFSDEPLETGWGSTVDAMLDRRQQGITAGDLAALPPGLPAGLVDVLRSCLAPKCEDRCPSAAAAAARLRLCQHPGAQRLLASASRGWRPLAQRYCAWVVVLIALAANGPAALFNFKYNNDYNHHIFARFPQAQEKFWLIQCVTNAVAFPLGIALVLALGLPVQRAIRRRVVRRGDDPESSGSCVKPRIRALWLGHAAAVIGTVEWGIAGISYPAALQISGVALGSAVYLHYMASLALTGLIAASYPFFGITLLGVRAFYVGLLEAEPPGAVEANHLERLVRWTWRYLVMAASVPMLAVALLVAAGGQEDRLALEVLSGASLLGFALIFYLARRIQADIATLLWLVQPAAGAEGADSGSFILPELRHSK